VQATGREKDCIDTYKWLEDNHPIPKVKKQVRLWHFVSRAAADTTSRHTFAGIFTHIHNSASAVLQLHCNDVFGMLLLGLMGAALYALAPRVHTLYASSHMTAVDKHGEPQR
jgi:hypothetical protein